MRILVTGGRGFVGSEVVRQLNRAGIEPVVTSRAAHDGPEVAGRSVTVGGLGPDTDWREALVGVDAVVHLAARPHVLDDRVDDPLEEYRKVNVVGSLVLARQAFECGVRRFVFVSSAGVAGATSTDRSFRESDEPRPHSPYTVSKLEAERALLSLGSEAGREVVCIRPPLVYGPGAPGNLQRLNRMIARGWPLPFSSIRNQRSLVGVGNLAELLILVATSSRGAGGSYYVADGDVSTPELAAAIGEGMNVKVRMLPIPVEVFRVGAYLVGRSALFDQLCASQRFDSTLVRETFS